MSQLTDADQKIIAEAIDRRIAAALFGIASRVDALIEQVADLRGATAGNSESISELYAALSALRAELPMQVENATLSITRAQVARIMREENAP